MLPSDFEIEPDPLRLRLDFHKESVLLHDYSEGLGTVRRVSALDVAHALVSELDISTGVLPPDALWYTKTATGARLAIWREPRVWRVGLRTGHDVPLQRLRLPMPGLVFVCTPDRESPYVFAAKERPRKTSDQLYRCPTFNVFQDGRVCPGTHKFVRDPSLIPEDFFKSRFSLTGDTRQRSVSHPDELMALWTELHGQPAYPLDDLVPALQVADAMRLGQ